MKNTEIKKAVRKSYAEIARGGGSCCGPQSSCCSSAAMATSISKDIGYSSKDMMGVPQGANLGLGCGNPVALAGLKKGEVVVDLGAGAGFDCFLAAKRVGPKGKVIGVDMTPEMVEKARVNACRARARNVEFRLGEIEHLPVADNFADVIISNCVINLAPDKKRVFQEAFRVLKPGGRLMVSDIILLKPLPAAIRKSVGAYVGCISGASLKTAYLAMLRSAGFRQVVVIDQKVFNSASVLNSGHLLGVIPKTILPSYKEFYEDRWFSPGTDTRSRQIELLGEEVPFGTDLLFRLRGIASAIIGVEICE
ncbi:MAG: arsenite methyltransferase, partial [candidate division WOR-3 bacterium]